MHSGSVRSWALLPLLGVSDLLFFCGSKYNVKHTTFPIIPAMFWRYDREMVYSE